MRVLVCGGRDFEDWNFVWRSLDRIKRERGMSAIIHGGADGVDDQARQWAWNHVGLPVHEYSADWQKHGRAAGPIRNRRMLSDGKPDLVVAFPGGRGTADMVRQARKAGVEVLELNP